MLDNLNLVFPILENHTRLQPNMAREQTVQPHPAEEISPQTSYWHKELTSYFLVQFGTF